MCELWSGDFEECRVWSEERRKARKRHRCDSCGGAILPGASYVRHFSILDAVTSENLCGPCSAARDAFVIAHGSMTPTPGYFPDLLRECARDDPGIWGPELEALERRGQEAR